MIAPLLCVLQMLAAQPTPEQVREAKVVVLGQLVEIERREDYERVGGWLSRLLGFGVEEVRAYRGKVVVDRTLRGSVKHHWWIMFFAKKDNETPAIGRVAIWVLHERPVFRLSECVGYRAAPHLCPWELWLVLESDDDVVPIQARAVLERWIAEQRP